MRRIYVILLVLAAFFVADQANAQQTIDSGTGRTQNVYVELAGQGLILTANYDTRFSNKRNGIGGRIGIGYIADSGDHITTIPIGLNYLLGKGRNFFEVGLGATYFGTSSRNNDFLFSNSSGDSSVNTVIGTMSFSYRLQPIDSGFSLRAGITPVFNGDGFIPYYAGLSLGYTFSGK